MLPSSLLAALTAGATVVTPTRRLAREVASRHDAHCRDAGLRSWPAAQALPWTRWLEALWESLLTGAPEPYPQRLLGKAEAAFVWRRIVADDATGSLPWLDPAAVAEGAAAAWELVHAWGAGGESWRGWSGGDDDPAAFSRWAERYAAHLAREGAIDHALLPDVLATVAADVARAGGGHVVLAGFADPTPQQQRLLVALAAAGMAIERCELPGQRHAGAVRLSAPDPRTELERSLAWARALALANREARIGIAVVDLAQRRAEVRALAEDILCPELQWPGREEVPRPYELSLGEALSDVPLCAAALDAIALLVGTQPCGAMAAWLRSPYLAGEARAWLGRAEVEREWLEAGRVDVALADVLESLRRHDPVFERRLREGRNRIAAPGRATPRQWAGLWRAWLDAVGWPGERTLSSAEFQARRAWDEVLNEFAAIANPELGHPEAATALRALAKAVVFQPEGTAAPIRIMGLLEAAGLEFDALWVAGLTADAWPPVPHANPFLPRAWQVERGVPGADADRDLAFARVLTEQLAAAAPAVVLSFATQAEEHAVAPSALIEAFPEAAIAAPDRSGTIRAIFAARPPALEAIRDGLAPPLGVVRQWGGTGVIEAQGDCPFKAQAKYRLEADPWPAATAGLSDAERGSLVHTMLAAFWQEIGDQAGFLALAPAELAARLERAAAHAFASLPAQRRRSLPPLVAAGEPARLVRTAGAWLDTVERWRPAFHVRATESAGPLRLGGLELRVRIDRLDELAGGAHAIIDYKTGHTLAVAKWLSERPEAPQLGLYALALKAAEPALPVRAVAYAHVRPGECRASGIAAAASLWPGLEEPRKVGIAGIANWRDVEAFWARSLEALAREFVAGRASVDPRRPRDTCRLCQRMSLCRIEVDLQDEVATVENGDG